MNKKGKEYIARKTADNIKTLFANQKLAPITLEWNENPGSPTSTAIEQDTDQDIIVPIDRINMKWYVDEEIDRSTRTKPLKKDQV